MRIVLPAGLVAMIGLTITATAYGQEKTISRAELPAAVDSAMKVQSRGATLRGLSEERENGHTYYEVELRVKTHNRDVLMDSTGAVVEVEEQVSLDSIPAPAKAALNAQARGGRISEVESLSKRGHLVAYEAQVQSDGKRREIQVGPDGEGRRIPALTQP